MSSRKNTSAKVQSVRFDRAHWSPAKAEEWLREHGYHTTWRGKGVDITENQLRYRQADPGKRGSGHIKEYRSKKLPNHIILVLKVQ